MKVFLAGSSAECTRVQRWAKRLDDAGAEHTSRWWEGCRLWAGKDAERDIGEQHEIASASLCAITEAAVVWVLFPRTMAGGSMVEIGLAIATSRLLVVTGQGVARTIFTSMSNYRDESDEAGFVEVMRMGGLV